MKILSYNPGHDGAIAYLKDGKLLFSIEAEKNSNYRYSSISNHDVFRVLGELDEIPDVICVASFSDRKESSEEDKNILELLLGGPYKDLSTYENLKDLSYYNIGLDNLNFRNFAGIYSDEIFDIFYQFADKNMKRGFPLLIAGGCGLNCDWNTKWKQSGLFSDVFVPPVANDSGSAIGTAIDAQLYYTGNPKIDWSVYSGLNFDIKKFFDETKYDTYDVNDNFVADILANDLILAWVNGKYEIGPRALGNRSIIAAPFSEDTRIRLNEIKQREQFRPIAPVCLEEDAAEWFGCEYPSPHMLYTFIARTDALKAVTHVNKTARIQTVSQNTNLSIFKLLTEFKKLTGYGVLCNTSLNFNGRGFINKIDDLSRYCIEHHLDGFVTEEKCYLLKTSQVYQPYKALGRIKS